LQDSITEFKLNDAIYLKVNAYAIEIDEAGDDDCCELGD
jgi:hypothetical protein